MKHIFRGTNLLLTSVLQLYYEIINMNEINTTFSISPPAPLVGFWSSVGAPFSRNLGRDLSLLELPLRVTYRSWLRVHVLWCVLCTWSWLHPSNRTQQVDGVEALWAWKRLHTRSEFISKKYEIICFFSSLEANRNTSIFHFIWHVLPHLCQFCTVKLSVHIWPKARVKKNLMFFCNFYGN